MKQSSLELVLLACYIACLLALPKSPLPFMNIMYAASPKGRFILCPKFARRTKLQQQEEQEEQQQPLDIPHQGQVYPSLVISRS
jgi:hypothetical protein